MLDQGTDLFIYEGLECNRLSGSTVTFLDIYYDEATDFVGSVVDNAGQIPLKECYDIIEQVTQEKLFNSYISGDISEVSYLNCVISGVLSSTEIRHLFYQTFLDRHLDDPNRIKIPEKLPHSELYSTEIDRQIEKSVSNMITFNTKVMNSASLYNEVVLESASKDPKTWMFNAEGNFIGPVEPVKTKNKKKIRTQTKKRRKMITKSLKAVNRFFSEQEERTFRSGGWVTISGITIDFLVSATDKISAIGHDALRVKVLNKEGVYLTNLCFYFEGTPCADQLIGIKAFVDAGLEDEILKKGNLVSPSPNMSDLTNNLVLLDKAKPLSVNNIIYNDDEEPINIANSDLRASLLGGLVSEEVLEYNRWRQEVIDYGTRVFFEDNQWFDDTFHYISETKSKEDAINFANLVVTRTDFREAKIEKMGQLRNA